jgi:Tfp pilus assembly protein PilX
MFMATKFPQPHKEGGFALLMTLIVVGVLVSIGIAVLDLSVKQVRLSTNAKESETAFHAANAGVECAEYWRRVASTSMESGAAISPACFSASATSNTVNQVVAGVTGTANVYLYNYNFSWGAKPRCTKIQTLVINAVSTTTVSGMRTLISGYPTDTSKPCAGGEKCTVISTRGYNRLCTSASGYGSVEREVLLQF